MFKTVAISSGHGSKIAGAIGPEPWGLVEVTEARRVTDQIAAMLEQLGVEVDVFHDNVSTNVSDNVSAIAKWHNEACASLNLSVHFNAHSVTESPRGCEVLYKEDAELAAALSAAIAEAGLFIDRGPKYRDDLSVLNKVTGAPMLMIETCFVDSHADADAYRAAFEGICEAVAHLIADAGTPETAKAKSPAVKIAIEVADTADIHLTVNGLDVFLGTSDAD